MNPEVFDITIIGGGPAGLFAAYYATLRQMKVKIIESLNDLGGQLNSLYPHKEIKDIPGFSHISGTAYTKALLKQLEGMKYTLCLNEQVQQIEKVAEDIFQITTSSQKHFSKTIVIATGGGAFIPRKLPFAKSEALENQAIFYHVPPLETLKNQKIAILGGGDSAVDWGNLLGPLNNETFLIHRRNEFRALNHHVAQLEKNNVTLLTPYVLKDFTFKEQQLFLQLQHVKTKEFIEKIADKLLVSYGFINTHDSFLPKEIVDNNGKVPITSFGMTKIPGIFACGDITTYEGKVALIATGLGEAPTAVNNAYFYLHPNEKLQPIHSTSLS